MTAVLEHRVGEVEEDVDALFERTKGVTDYGRRLITLERGREEDRKEISAEIADLRRTIVQAMVAVFIATIGILASLATVIK